MKLHRNVTLLATISYMFSISAVFVLCWLVLDTLNNFSGQIHKFHDRAYLTSLAAVDLKAAIDEIHDHDVTATLYANHDTRFDAHLIQSQEKLWARVQANMDVIKHSRSHDTVIYSPIEEKLRKWEIEEQQILLALKAEKFTLARELIELNYTSTFEPLEVELKKLQAFYDKRANDYIVESDSEFSSTKRHTLVLVGLIAVGLIVVVGLLLFRILQLQRLLTQEMSTDPLTGVCNRRCFLEQAEKEFVRSLRNNENVAVVSIDLDHFKQINDTFGHATGDLVLKQFASVVANNLRITDIFGRIGGEEFVIVLPECSLVSAIPVIERIRKSLEKTAVVDGKQEVFVTASFGVTQIQHNDLDFTATLARADKALYQAKHEGRNRVCIGESGLYYDSAQLP